MIPIKGSDGLKKLIQALAFDIGRAQSHWQLRCDLIRALEAHRVVEHQSRTFWFLTLNAHESAAILHLSRAFDQTPSALHLSSLLKTIRTNLDLFKEDEFRRRKVGDGFVDSLAAASRIPGLDTLEKDILECSDDDPLVNKLVKYRGNALAHRSAKLTLSDEQFQSQLTLTFEDIPVLLARADDVLNRYSGLFSAEYYSPEMVGHDDYKFVIRSIESEVKRLTDADLH